MSSPVRDGGISIPNGGATLGAGWGGRPSYRRGCTRPPDPLFFSDPGSRRRRGEEKRAIEHEQSDCDAGGEPSLQPSRGERPTKAHRWNLSLIPISNSQSTACRCSRQGHESWSLPTGQCGAMLPICPLRPAARTPPPPRPHPRMCAPARRSPPVLRPSTNVVLCLRPAAAAYWPSAALLAAAQ